MTHQFESTATAGSKSLAPHSLQTTIDLPRITGTLPRKHCLKLTTSICSTAPTQDSSTTFDVHHIIRFRNSSPSKPQPPRTPYFRPNDLLSSRLTGLTLVLVQNKRKIIDASPPRPNQTRATHRIHVNKGQIFRRRHEESTYATASIRSSKTARSSASGQILSACSKKRLRVVLPVLSTRSSIARSKNG